MLNINPKRLLGVTVGGTLFLRQDGTWVAVSAGTSGISQTDADVRYLLATHPAKDVTAAKITNWDTAHTHSTSTHAPVNAQKNSDITQSEIEAKLTGSISSHTHAYLASNHDASNVTSTARANWDAAYTHASSTHAPVNAQKNSDITKAEIEAKLTGELTSHTHAYLASNHDAKDVTSGKIANWDSAYGWGNHASGGYLTALPSHDHDTVYLKLAGGTLSSTGNTSGVIVLGGKDSGSADIFKFTADGSAWLKGHMTFGSDARFKGNVRERSGGLARVLALRPVTVDRLDMASDNEPSLIAQEVEQVIPEAVRSFATPDGERLAVDYARTLVVELVGAVQELSREVSVLRDQLRDQSHGASL